MINAEGIQAAIDDGILNIPFRVNGFRTVFFDSMGNAFPEVSDSNSFSQRQKEQIRRLARRRYFYVSGIRAIGPDGMERDIAVIEVQVNNIFLNEVNNNNITPPGYNILKQPIRRRLQESVLNRDVKQKQQGTVKQVPSEHIQSEDQLNDILENSRWSRIIYRYIDLSKPENARSIKPKQSLANR